MRIGPTVNYALALADGFAGRATQRRRLDASSLDRVPTDLIPSVAAGGTRNLVLPEIDQNGMIFADREIDQQFSGIGGPREARSAQCAVRISCKSCWLTASCGFAGRHFDRHCSCFNGVRTDSLDRP